MSRETSLSKLSVPDLLALWVNVLGELRARGAIRSANNPVGDYAEFLVARHYGVEVEPPSTKGYDIRTPSGELIQVKALRRTQPGRTGLSRLGNLDEPGFDAIVIVALSADFSSWEAWHVPLSAVRRHARFSKAWQGPKLSLTGRLVSDAEVTPLSLQAL